MYIKVWSLTFSSDLRKPWLVPGKSLSSTQIISSVLEKSQIYIMLNRMRSLHMQLYFTFHFTGAMTRISSLDILHLYYTSLVPWTFAGRTLLKLTFLRTFHVEIQQAALHFLSKYSLGSTYFVVFESKAVYFQICMAWVTYILFHGISDIEHFFLHC